MEIFLLLKLIEKIDKLFKNKILANIHQGTRSIGDGWRGYMGLSELGYT